LLAPLWEVFCHTFTAITAAYANHLQLVGGVPSGCENTCSALAVERFSVHVVALMSKYRRTNEVKQFAYE
jgi:hypothetical protein